MKYYRRKAQHTPEEMAAYKERGPYDAPPNWPTFRKVKGVSNPNIGRWYREQWLIKQGKGMVGDTINGITTLTL